MVLPKDSFQMRVQDNVLESWRQLLASMEESLNLLEKGIEEYIKCQHVPDAETKQTKKIKFGP